MRLASQQILSCTRMWATLAVTSLLCFSGGAAVAQEPDSSPLILGKGRSQGNRTLEERVKALKFRSRPLSSTRTPKITGQAVALAQAQSSRALKVLVIAVDGTEPTYASIQAFLDQIGIPYDTFLSVNHLTNPAQNPLPAFSSGPTTANYQAVVLTIGNLAYCNASGTCQSTFSPADWAALDNFTAAFSIRTLSYYTFPEPRYGLSYVSAVNTTSASPVNVTVPSTGVSTFSYLKPTASIPVKDAYMYLAVPVAAAGETTTPVLRVSQGGVNYTVGAIHTAASGQQYLALTMDNNPFLMHSLALNYGLFNWVTKGLFLGGRKIYLSPQVDDLFIPNDLFDASVPECVPGGFLIDPTTDLSDSCDTVRIGGTALQTTYSWQASLNANPQTAQFRVALAFNGYGTTRDGGAPRNDTLVSTARTRAANFYWVNHTYAHNNLDCYNPAPGSGVCPPATVAQSTSEITQNVAIANSLGFGAAFDRASMVTPEISGLANPNFISAAHGNGIRYLVSDASRPGQQPPSANTGIRNAINPEILQVPRFATNIFYNVHKKALDTVGSEPDEYNHFFGPSGIARLPNGDPYFAIEQTYTQIINTESNNLLMNMLRNYAYPSMFHQSNLHIFGNNKSLFIDTIQGTIDKFKQLSSLPIISLPQSSIGALLKARMAYNASGVTASWTPGTTGGQGSITIMVNQPAVIDMTGVVCPIAGATCETYGGQTIAHIPVTPAAPVTIASPI